MNFSKTASYSLNVLSYMSLHEGSISASELHRKLGIPYPYLRQVLAGLSRSGFIYSIRGRKGGFTFNKSKKEISLADIIESTDNLDKLNRCILGFEKCPFDNECIMHPIWASASSNIIKALKETSLSSMVVP